MVVPVEAPAAFSSSRLGLTWSSCSKTNEKTDEASRWGYPGALATVRAPCCPRGWPIFDFGIVIYRPGTIGV